MKIYYQITLLLACALAVYGFIAPYLISYPSDILSILGFVVGIGAIPVFVLWGIKIIKKIIQ